MDKEELLNELSAKVNLGEITREEIAERLVPAVPAQYAEPPTQKKHIHFSATKMLYVLGASVVVVGIAIFVAQIWEDIGSIGRVSVTLGLGLLMSAIGSVLFIKKPGESIGPVFHFIGGAIIPWGALVMLGELDLDYGSEWPFSITFGAIFAFYLLLNTIHKHPVLTFFTIANGTAFVYLLVGSIAGSGYRRYSDLYTYLTMIIGGAYLLLSHSFRGGSNRRLIGALYLFGIAGVLGAAFSRVFDSGLWQLLYFAFVFGGLLLSIYMKSRIILVVSTVFLLAHLTYITNKYFADSLGWPISLVILGLVFIGLGYGSVRINKKYIKETAR